MSKKLEKILIIACLVMMIGGTLTFLMTWRNLGFGEAFLFAWLSSFALCVLCIAPIGGVLSFLVHKLVNTLLPRVHKIQQDIIFGLIMAVLMESIMAIVTTLNVHGWMAVESFFAKWSITFVAALPMGIFFSILMSLVIKRRLVAYWTKA
ncbi:DUF2798 domain-containing protein [Marinomonas sp. THO17]|uniref:DUF2798 domain-containing protein n=1 Tax=Marinomonas sp. THO17 TaxID=3149048 RepID=UPI00336C1449